MTALSGAEGCELALIAGFGESVVRFRGDLLLEMRSRGWRLVVIAPNMERATRDWLEKADIAYEDLPLARAGMNPVEDARYCRHLYRALLRHRPKAVLAYTIKPVVYGIPVAALAGVQSRYALITGLGYAFAEGARPAVAAIARNLYRVALKLATGVFFQNPDDRALFEELGLLNAHVATHVVNGSGIDINRFAQQTVPSGPVHFLLIARLIKDKGIREYVEAARLLKLRYPDTICSLAGAIDENPNSITQAELDGWCAEGVVSYLGILQDVRPALRECSVYVLPSYAEGTPRTVLEALAIGRAVVTTDAPGCRETVREGDNGYLVQPRSADELCVAMERFILQPDLIRAMGTASRNLAEQKYDVRLVNQSMLREMNL